MSAPRGAGARAVRALIERDLSVVARSRPLMAPLIIVPLLIALILPLGISFVPRLMLGVGASIDDAARMLGAMPAPIRAELAGLEPAQAMTILLTVHILAPLFLLLPFLVANVIAADSFAGERERKTLEALLYTPFSDRELLLAKTLVALIPALVVTLASFIVYAVVVNATAWPVMHRMIFPNTTWIWMIVWVAPAVSLVGLGAMVIVSMRVRGVQEAMQLSGLLVLPIVALLIAQARGSLMLGPRAVAIMGLVLWIIAAALMAYGVRVFRRERLIAGA